MFKGSGVSEECTISAKFYYLGEFCEFGKSAPGTNRGNCTSLREIGTRLRMFLTLRNVTPDMGPREETKKGSPPRRSVFCAVLELGLRR